MDFLFKLLFWPLVIILTIIAYFTSLFAPKTEPVQYPLSQSCLSDVEYQEQIGLPNMPFPDWELVFYDEDERVLQAEGITDEQFYEYTKQFYEYITEFNYYLYYPTDPVNYHNLSWIVDIIDGNGGYTMSQCYDDHFYTLDGLGLSTYLHFTVAYSFGEDGYVVDMSLKKPYSGEQVFEISIHK